VRHSRRIAPLWLGTLLLAACGGSPPADRVPSPGEGTSVTFQHRVGWPFDLRRVAVAVDGELVYSAVEERVRSSPGEVARLALPPGDHFVAVHAVLAHPCEDMGELRQWMTLRGARTFRVGDAPARVDVHLAAVGSGDAERRPRLGFAAHGATFVDAEAPDPLPDAPHCGERGPVESSVCRVEALDAHASRVRDVVLRQCARDKLDALAEVRRVHGGLAPGDPMRGYLEERALDLESEARDCLPGRPIDADVSVSVVEGCGDYEEPLSSAGASAELVTR